MLLLRKPLNNAKHRFVVLRNTRKSVTEYILKKRQKRFNQRFLRNTIVSIYLQLAETEPLLQLPHTHESETEDVISIT